MTDKRIASAAVREICGGVSDMTIWRWQHDPALNFPKPAYVSRRRYWREADIIAWWNAQNAEIAA